MQQFFKVHRYTKVDKYSAINCWQQKKKLPVTHRAAQLSSRMACQASPVSVEGLRALRNSSQTAIITGKVLLRALLPEM